MDKEISVKTSIYELVTAHPQIKDILFDLGFKDIVKPGMIATVGRFMNLAKGSKMKDISMETIKEAFLKHGFILKEEQ